MKENVKQALDAVGSKAKMARALGVTRSAISQWTHIPVNRVAQVELLTGIPRAKLRPDIFGDQPEQAAS
jgi:DNA-binding transcriptional regulator YdaS (Cro superfamily)